MNTAQWLCIIYTIWWHPYINPINLGFSSFLDGGPVRPEPGWYFQGAFQYYNAHKFLDGCGKIVGTPSPHFNYTQGVVTALYQSKAEFLYAHGGISLNLPFVPTIHLDKNAVGITESGAGICDFILGFFLQFKPIYFNNRPILVQRLQFETIFPTGKFKPAFLINPGNGCYSIDVYWAGTLFLAPRWAASWRMYYYWNAKIKSIQVQEGPKYVINYSTEFEVIKNLWIGAAGYFEQQLKDTALRNVPVPQSKERIFAIGPGALYSPTKDLHFWANIYFEKLARNRPQGISAIFRFLYHF